jgi:hypothetical protein
METVNAAGETVDANGTVIWFVPIVSRVSGVTTVLEIPAGLIAFAIMDFHRGIDRGWASLIPVLLNARTTLEPDGSPDEAELEAQFREHFKTERPLNQIRENQNRGYWPLMPIPASKGATRLWRKGPVPQRELSK